jgi:hypothetical protein
MGSEGDEEAPVFKKMEGEEEGGEPVTMEEDDSALPPAEDLFSEIHLGQLKRLEKQLESSETEKQKMCASAREVEESLDAALREVRKSYVLLAQTMHFIGDVPRKKLRPITIGLRRAWTK